MKKKFEVDRRTMLKGTGVALALPMLEIMMPSVLRAQTQEKPFIVNMVWPNGLPHYYKDGEADIDYRGVPWYMLNHYKSKMTGDLKAASYMVGDSFHNWTTGGFGGHYGNSIGVYTGGIDTNKYKSFEAFKASGNNGDNLMMETYDQRIARHFGLKTTNAILADGAGSINTFANYRTVQSMSWYKHTDGKTVRPIHLDQHPRELFDRLAGAEVLTDQASIVARRQILMNKDTILSAALDSINQLKKKLGTEDKARLDDYLTGVRELDEKTGRELASLGEPATPSNKRCGDGMSRPREYEYGRTNMADYLAKIPVFQDLMTMSMECGTHHVHGLSLAGSGGYIYLRDYRDVPKGLPGSYHAWHPISHWKSSGGGNEGLKNYSAADAARHRSYQRETYAEYAMMSVDWFVDWMQKLHAKKRPDGTSLFDNTFAAITSFIGDGNVHGRIGIPTLMAGTAGGRIPKHNGHHFTGRIPQANIWLSVMQALGINESSFGKGAGIAGGSTGTLNGFQTPHS